MPFQFETTPQRSELMKRIRSKATKPEIELCKALWQAGFRYRKNYSKLPGKPDIALTSKKIAVFVDGEFWHGFNWAEKKQRLKSNQEYWIPKIERNISRDIHNNQILVEMGWSVIRFWEKDIKKDLSSCVDQIINLAMMR